MQKNVRMPQPSQCSLISRYILLAFYYLTGWQNIQYYLNRLSIYGYIVKYRAAPLIQLRNKAVIDVAQREGKKKRAVLTKVYNRLSWMHEYLARQASLSELNIMPHSQVGIIAWAHDYKRLCNETRNWASIRPCDVISTSHHNISYICAIIRAGISLGPRLIKFSDTLRQKDKNNRSTTTCQHPPPFIDMAAKSNVAMFRQGNGG